ncbi:hypothetical protein ACLKA6_012139 [Drosophila palustris]
MRSSTIVLGCALLAICLSHLPGSDGQDTTTEAATTVAGDTTTVAADTTVAGDTTTVASSDTTTIASTGGKKKKKITRKFKIVRKPGKKTIKRHRKGGKKASLFKKY